MNTMDYEQLDNGIHNLLDTNVSWGDDEALLVVTDVPRAEQVAAVPADDLELMMARVLLARRLTDVARQVHGGADVEFLPFAAVERHGAEPPTAVAEKMAAADVVVALTTHSLSHTDARVGASAAGTRVASMPGFLPEMFFADGPMNADYEAIREEGRQVAERLTGGQQVRVSTGAGTELSFSLGDREALIDDGLLHEDGSFGNLPAGESFIAPEEGSARGRLVVTPGWFAGLDQELTLVFDQGQVIDVIGGGTVGEDLRDILQLGDSDPAAAARRNLAEFGVGTNPQAERTDNVLEAEKIRGTVHLAIGDNAHMGGEVEADFHQDFIINDPDVLIDGEFVMREGQFAWD